MATTQPTPYPHFKAIEHVVYEYANLLCAGFYSIHGNEGLRTNADDAFLLGYRKLGDFLMNDYPRKDDDVLALDYMPSASARKWDLSTWGSWRRHMNKQLTHIAYARVTAPREWDHRIWVPPLEREFRAAWGAFLEAVIDVNFKAEFEKQIAHCQGKPGFGNIPLR